MTEAICLTEQCQRPPRVKGMCRPCYDADYHRQNAERKRAAAAAWRRANPDRVRAANVAWRAANPDAERAQKRAYAEAHREQVRRLARQVAATRKARKLGAVVTRADYAAILAEHGMVCHLCGGDIPPGDLHFDHVIPLARGGAHSPENIRPAHARCNQRKGDRLTTTATALH